jgi:hypothetical protein
VVKSLTATFLAALAALALAAPAGAHGPYPGKPGVYTFSLDLNVRSHSPINVPGYTGENESGSYSVSSTGSQDRQLDAHLVFKHRVCSKLCGLGTQFPGSHISEGGAYYFVPFPSQGSNTAHLGEQTGWGGQYCHDVQTYDSDGFPTGTSHKCEPYTCSASLTDKQVDKGVVFAFGKDPDVFDYRLGDRASAFNGGGPAPTPDCKVGQEMRPATDEDGPVLYGYAPSSFGYRSIHWDKSLLYPLQSRPARKSVSITRQGKARCYGDLDQCKGWQPGTSTATFTVKLLSGPG